MANQVKDAPGITASLKGAVGRHLVDDSVGHRVRERNPELDDISTGDPARDTFMQDYDLWGEDGAREPIEKGVMDIFGYAQHYISEHYRTKSLRCGDCQHEQGCRGMHINHVRAHGYSLMQPVPMGKGDSVEG